MAKEQIVRLYREAQLNPSLKEALNSMPNPADFVSLAKQYGYDFTLEEWQETMRFSVEELKCKLSEIPGI